MESNLYKLSKSYEIDHIMKNIKNNSNCSLGINCKGNYKNIILYIMIGFIIVLSTISLIMDITYSVNNSKTSKKNIIEDDFEYINNTNIKYNIYGNLFLSNVVY